MWSSLMRSSGFVIDRISADDQPPTAELITQHQSLIGVKRTTKQLIYRDHDSKT